MRRWLLVLVALPLVACDPCAGTLACHDPGFRAEGQLFWHLDGEPAGDVHVTFIRTGGAELGSDTLVTTSNAAGIFRLAARSTGNGSVEGQLIFQPPAPHDGHVFGVPGVRLDPRRTRADAQPLGIWGVGPFRSAPHISYLGELFYVDMGERAAGVEVEFQRTAGIMVRPDTFVVESDASGRFPLVMTPEQEGEVVGRLLIRPPAPHPTLTVTDLRLQTIITANEVRLAGVWGIPSP
jgi:hypothetical protein